MTAQTTTRNMPVEAAKPVSRSTWIKIGMAAALISIAAVLLVQALALSLWPEISAFKPLNSYPRSALFTLIPVVTATALFARLAKTRVDPGRPFLMIAGVVLLLSFIPDFFLPLPNRTLLASSVAAGLHIVAAIGIVATILIGYRR